MNFYSDLLLLRLNCSVHGYCCLPRSCCIYSSLSALKLESHWPLNLKMMQPCQLDFFYVVNSQSHGKTDVRLIQTGFTNRLK